MTVRIDLAAQTLTCSVHDLLVDPLRRSVGGTGEGLARLTVGAELHRIVQARLCAEDAGYRPEVTVDAAFAIDGWSLRVVGRADGVGSDASGRPAVEEIKTLHFRTDLHALFAQERLERHRWQVRIYAACLFPDGAAAARLRLVDLGGADERVEEVPWSPREVHAFLRGRLHALVAAEQERERVRAVWRRAAESLAFPFDAPRPVQGEAIGAVLASLEAGRHLLLSAPTGVGKTAAALYPAVKLALGTGRRLVFLTAKTLQQQLAVETLQRMQQGGWRSIQIRAKARMCANREVICHEEFCDHAADYGLKLAERGVVPALLSRADHLDPERTYEVADTARVCPFEVSLEVMRECSAVVCDFNYVFDPAISLFGPAEEGGLEDCYLIIDEAHNLVDRAREYFSPRLGRGAIRRALELLAGYRQKVCRDLAHVLGDLDALVAKAVGDGLPPGPGVQRIGLDPRALAEVRLGLDALIAPYFNFKRTVELWLSDDPVVEVLLSLARLVDLLEQELPELVPLAERTAEGDEQVRLFCLDASRWIGAVLDRCAGAVAMSATLEPFEFYRDLLGFDADRTDTLSLPSPFPAENRLVVAVDQVDTSYRFRSHAYGRIAEVVAELAPSGRNSLVLFPSYAFLREVADRLHVPGHRVEVQRFDDSEASRRAVLGRLRANDDPVMLLGVLGGVFAEGVDYPGEMLSQVVVVSPALPQVGPERELLRDHYADRFGLGFEYAYLIPGMTRVVQAAGRLIRSADDRGVIVLVCRRFLRDPYFSLLPREWTAGDPGAIRADDARGRVAAFFATAPVEPC